MNINLDENLPQRLVSELQALGHDIDTVRSEHLAGRDDDEVWYAAQAADRFLITQDLDFSDVRRFTPGTHARVAAGAPRTARQECPGGPGGHAVRNRACRSVARMEKRGAYGVSFIFKSMQQGRTFLAVDNVAALQTAADRLNPTIIRRQLDYWTLILGPKFSKG